MAAETGTAPRRAVFQPAGDAALDRAIVAQAVEWLVRLQSGAASAAERAACEHWRGAHPEHEQAWQRVRGLGADLRDGVHGLAPETARGALRGADAARRRWALKAFVLAASGGVGAWALRDDMAYWRADYRTATGERRDVLLPDGTRVVLNTRSAIDVDFGAAERGIRLLGGEIMVSSGHDPAARPLVVHAGPGRVVPIGTRFLVRAPDASAPGQVVVLEGQVELGVAGREGTLRLPAGQGARYAADGISAPEPGSENAAAWTQGVLVVERMRLDDFLVELGRYRPGVLRCDPAVGAILVSGAFPVARTDAVLDMLEEALPVRRRSLGPYWTTIAAR